jgi:two-component system, OmpR family, alkaline phosphatase synthesis response regulator PhoP
MKIKKILIIEDDLDQIELVKWNLENKGFTVFACSDGVEGIKTYVKNKPDLILLDLNLPYIDGIDIVDCLKRNNLLNEIPIIIISGTDEQNFQKAISDINPVKVFKKPFIMGQLLQYIQSL